MLNRREIIRRGLPGKILSLAGLVLAAVLLCVGWSAVVSGSSGGRSDRLRLVLDELNRDIRCASGLIAAGTERIVLLDGNGALRTYRYQNHVLWKDNKPLICDVDAFRFEYRDCRGSIVMSERNMRNIETVVYSSRIQDRNEAVWTHERIDIHSVPAMFRRAEKPSAVMLAGTNW